MKMTSALLFSLVSFAFVSRADLVECVNGDRFNGTVLSLDEKSIKLESEITGIMTLPREKVSTIHLGVQGKAVPASSSTNRVVGAADILRILTEPRAGAKAEASGKVDPKAVEQVENEFLAGTTPETQAMFKEMLQGLMSGTLNMQGLRGQAKSALEQLKDLQKDFDEDEGGQLLGNYATILENFLKEATNAPAQTPPPQGGEKQ
jgi:hypothetical protein